MPDLYRHYIDGQWVESRSGTTFESHNPATGELIGTFSGIRIAQEEIFEPVTALIPVQSLAEAVDVVNGVEYGLSASIYTQDVNKAFTTMRDVNTGILYVNAGTIGAEIQLPFGGTKATGNGHREAGTSALDVFSEWQALYIDYSGKLQKAQIDAVGEEM